MKKLRLIGKYGNGKYTLVDDEDYGFLNKFRWSYEPRNSYARCSIGTKTIYLHQLVRPVDKASIVDHINRDTLDNRKENLRSCSVKENQWNVGTRKDNKSGYKGVVKRTKKPGRPESWIAQMKHNGEQIWIGEYRTKNEAAEAYNKKAKALRGKFAFLNQIIST